jgi:WD40-like Beta Propeller Repeat
MTVDSGEVFLADGHAADYRLAKFDASSGAFVAQFAQVPSLTFLHSGIAVGHATGEQEVYVGGDLSGTQEGVVAAFDAGGSFQPPPWRGTDTPSEAFGCFECSGPASIAVDNSGLSSAAGDVYVADREHAVVDVFEPLTGGGEKYVTSLEGPEPGVPFEAPASLAVSASSGDVLVEDDRPAHEVEEVLVPAETVIDVFEPAGLPGAYNFVRKIPLEAGGPLAVDSTTGNIYVVQSNGVDELGAAGEFIDRLTGTPAGPFSDVTSVTVDQASHQVYVGDYNQEKNVGSVDVFGPDLVVPDVKVIEPVSNLTPTSVTLRGTVNPLEAGEATCEFEYGTSTSYGERVECTHPVPNVNAEEPVESVSITGLSPDTTYHYRLDATNANATNTGECPEDCGEFTTSGAGIHSESVSNVKSTSATLEATVDPNNAPTTYYFQYGPSTGYGSEAPLLTAAEPHGAVAGSAAGDVQVSQHVQVGLSPATVYHYRVVAVTEPETGQFEEFDGPDQTFTTQTAGGGLPDGRAWEMVSPPDKHGANILSLAGGVRAVQASLAGDAMTYLATAPTEAQPEGFVGEVQVLSTRGPDGWASKDIATPHRAAASGIFTVEYRFFSSDLSLGAVRPLGTFDPALSAEASEATPYLRTDFFNGDVDQPCLPTTMSCYRPLVSGKPGFENVPPDTVFGEESEGKCKQERCGPELIEATPDLSHIVLKSTAALTSATVANALYEWGAGALQLVSVLPGSEGGAAVPGHLGNREDGWARAGTVSRDGSRVIWNTTVKVAAEFEERLYMSDTASGETKSVRLDAPEPGCLKEGRCGDGPVEPLFQAASSDGSKVFFTDTQRLTADAGAGPGEPDLYECGITEPKPGELECSLSDLTPLGNSGERADVQAGSKNTGPSQGAVVGASEDGSRVYFVADGVLENGGVPVSGAEHGQPNLYVYHAGATQLVAVLSGTDGPDWSGHHGQIADISARVSPNGRWLAFMSQRSLTGYDNRDVMKTSPDEEVYLYDDSSRRLVCASCDPTGARPSGEAFDTEATEPNEVFLFGERTWVGSGTRFAALVPGWTTPQHQSRYLSDTGRLFFDSHGALVPQDVNGTWDVYQYEPPGVGNCATSSSTFSERSGGCVGLISSGTSAEASAFLDASAVGGRDGEGHEGGGDVFFLTTGKLAPQDFDTSLDVYDAHECTVASPCLPVSPPPPPPCVTEASCKAAPSPQPQIFGSGGSATFSGAGNLAPPAPAKSKTAAQIRAEKLAKALRACRAKRSRHRRAVCEAKARKRYGPPHKPRRSHRAKKASPERGGARP